MVNLVGEWRVFVEYIGEKLEVYPLLECGGKIEATASLGNACFKKEFGRVCPKT